jgi:hypothetical protein
LLVPSHIELKRGGFGLPMPQEPAYAAERRQDAEAKAAYERAENRMFIASVRRRGVGGPKPDSMS